MKVLVACEESQAVTKELRRLGHEAYSCDIIGPSGDRPEWHIKQDVLPLLNGFCTFRTMDRKRHFVLGRWDMIIAFPPCTHIATSGAQWFEKKREDGRQREGIEFFCKFLTAKCPRIAIENPTGIISGGDYLKTYFPDLCEKYNLPRKETQRIQPWNFKDNVRKTTCLWLVGLDPLIPEVTEEPKLEFHEWTNKHGKKKRQPLWYYQALHGKQTGAARSKTFPGIARAMAEQWAGPERNEA